MPAFLKLQLLAILQGITEFLTVSSSAHLVLVQKWLNAESIVGQEGGPLLELLLHFGTLLAILAFYRRRLTDLACGLVRRDAPSWRYSLALVLSCIPAGLFYFLAHHQIESFFDGRPFRTGLLLICTGLILFSLRLIPASRPTADKPTLLKALGIGCAQALAILPGLSRSGSTFTAGRWLGLSSEAAFDFTFLMSIPVIGGGILLKLKKLSHLFSSGHTAALLTATLLAAVVGFASLKAISLVRRTGKIWWFGFYCTAVGLLLLLCH